MYSGSIVGWDNAWALGECINSSLTANRPVVANHCDVAIQIWNVPPTVYNTEWKIMCCAHWSSLDWLVSFSDKHSSMPRPLTGTNPKTCWHGDDTSLFTTFTQISHLFSCWIYQNYTEKFCMSKNQFPWKELCLRQALLIPTIWETISAGGL